MSHELTIFFGSAAAVIAAGVVIRYLALAENRSISLTVVDCAEDLFLAAVVVFPTTLIIEPKPKHPISFSASQLLATFALLVVIAVWAKGESRYICYWRQGEKRTKQQNGSLGAAERASRPTLMKATAFMLGNGLGFSVLFASVALSHHVAS